MEETFLDRLKKEREELNDKIVKLNAFITGNTGFGDLSDGNKFLLCQQARIMIDYRDILDVRLELIRK